MSAHAQAAPPGAGPAVGTPEMNVRDAAVYLDCSATFIYKLAQDSRIEHQRIGNRIRFRREWLDAYLAANHRKPAAVAQ